MKKSLQILIMLAIIGMNANSQTNVYHHMPDSNAIWSVTYGTGITVDNDNSCCDCSQYQNQITGDTIIGSYTYHKLSKSGVEYYYYYATACDFSHPTGGINGYCGAYREDTSARKVYVMMHDSTTEVLLYDFNWNVGDTIHPVFNLYNCPLTTIVSIDSILIGNNYRKRWNLSWQCGAPASIIEGIGSTYGLFERLANFEDGGHLTCFSQNDTSLYPNYLNGGCALVTVGIKDVLNNDEAIKVSPNPANNFITIHPSTQLTNQTLLITDVLGNKIYQQTLTGFDTKIDVSKWSEGVYFYEVRGNIENARGKFLVKK